MDPCSGAKNVVVPIYFCIPSFPTKYSGKLQCHRLSLEFRINARKEGIPHWGWLLSWGHPCQVFMTGRGLLRFRFHGLTQYTACF